MKKYFNIFTITGIIMLLISVGINILFYLADMEEATHFNLLFASIFMIFVGVLLGYHRSV